MYLQLVLQCNSNQPIDEEVITKYDSECDSEYDSECTVCVGL